MKRFRALIFDVDGTLAETEEVHRRAFNDAFSYFELPWFWDIGLYRTLLRVSGGKERTALHRSPCNRRDVAFRRADRRGAPRQECQIL